MCVYTVFTSTALLTLQFYLEIQNQCLSDAVIEGLRMWIINPNWRMLAINFTLSVQEAVTILQKER